MKKLIYILILILLLHSCKDGRQDFKTQEEVPTASENRDMNSEKGRLNDLLKVQNPQETQRVSSPILLKGEAKGYWFFEADAPVELLNENLEPIAKNYISAKGEWMTEDWVPFEATMEFDSPSTKEGYLIFHKANPSGLVENAMSDTLRITFEN